MTSRGSLRQTRRCPQRRWGSLPMAMNHEWSSGGDSELWTKSLGSIWCGLEYMKRLGREPTIGQK